MPDQVDITINEGLTGGDGSRASNMGRKSGEGSDTRIIRETEPLEALGCMQECAFRRN